VNGSYCVGIYVRLSRDDERQGESVSIENQKEMLQSYCKRQGWMVSEVFADDGWSGTNFDRPGFIRMMEAVREKRINLVLVKDLSRLGRDYIQVGTYTDCVFPYYHCRFIALNDGVDTFREGDDVTMIFKNVINDIYARDTSRKIRAVRRCAAENGKYMGYKAPYGYLRDPENKHRLIKDDFAADIVREMFALRGEGRGFREIADWLNKKGVASLRDYAKNDSGHLWCRESVKAILESEVYIGNLVQLKYGNISYKDHRSRKKPEDTWVRVLQSHDALVDAELWENVRRMDRKEIRKERSSADPFGGILYCGLCDKPLRRVVNKKKRAGEKREYTYYICRNHVCVSGMGIGKMIWEDVMEHAAPLDRYGEKMCELELCEKMRLVNQLVYKVEIGKNGIESGMPIIRIYYRFSRQS
jgi:DNA invertase Pin-like site-specific DNA recombinase